MRKQSGSQCTIASPRHTNGAPSIITGPPPRLRHGLFLLFMNPHGTASVRSAASPGEGGSASGSTAISCSLKRSVWRFIGVTPRAEEGLQHAGSPLRSLISLADAGWAGFPDARQLRWAR